MSLLVEFWDTFFPQKDDCTFYLSLLTLKYINARISSHLVNIGGIFTVNNNNRHVAIVLTFEIRLTYHLINKRYKYPKMAAPSLSEMKTSCFPFPCMIVYIEYYLGFWHLKTSPRANDGPYFLTFSALNQLLNKIFIRLVSNGDNYELQPNVQHLICICYIFKKKQTVRNKEEHKWHTLVHNSEWESNHSQGRKWAGSMDRYLPMHSFQDDSEKKR